MAYFFVVSDSWEILGQLSDNYRTIIGQFGDNLRTILAFSGIFNYVKTIHRFAQLAAHLTLARAIPTSCFGFLSFCALLLPLHD